MHLARRREYPSPLANFLHLPTLLWFHDAAGLDVDSTLELVTLGGTAIALGVAAGGATAPLLAMLWLLYLSLFNVGQTFLSFQWCVPAYLPHNFSWAQAPYLLPCMPPGAQRCLRMLMSPAATLHIGGRNPTSIPHAMASRDILLLEVGWAALWLAPHRRTGAAQEPPRAAVLLQRWVLFKLMFCSGAVKIQARAALSAASCITRPVA